MRNLKEQESRILAYPASYWQPLLDLIPIIEKTRDFGEMRVLKNMEENTFSLPFIKESELLSQFRKVLVSLNILIAFNWKEWETGKLILQDKRGVDGLDLIELCKLLTTIIRSDRFVEGNLVRCFESGLILKLLSRIRTINKKET